MTKLKVEVEFLKSELAETADAWGVGSFNDQDITVIGNKVEVSNQNGLTTDE